MKLIEFSSLLSIPIIAKEIAKILNVTLQAKCPVITFLLFQFWSYGL